MRNLLVITGIFSLVLFTGVASEADDKVFQLAVVPFEVRGQESLQHIRDGIFDMLSSRLFVPGKIQVMSREEAVHDEALSAADRGADYIVTGTINAIGGHYIIDARLVDVKQNKALATSSYAQKTLDDVIPWIERFSQEIRDKIAPQGALASVPPPIAGQPGSFFSPQAGAGIMPKTEDLLNPEFIRQFRSKALIPKFWRSQEFPMTLRGMDVGDMDGDGLNETVISDENNLWIFRFREGKLVEMFNQEAPGGAEILSLDVGDFNGNGRAEIYVCATAGYRMESFVLEYDGSTFRPIAEKLNHYVRVAYAENGRPLLVGQNRGLDTPFFGPVYRLEWSGGTLKQGKDLELPLNPAIFAFARADIISGEKGNLLILDANDKLRLFDEKGKMKWRSKDYFGGAKRSREEIDDFAGSTKSGIISKRAYFPVRILVCDLNGDEQTEILINRNIEAFGKFLERLRIYTGGEIHNLVWDGLTLTTSWKTRKFDGYVSDFQVKDFDNDGKDELVIALVLRTEWMDIIKKRSAVIAYDLNIPESGQGKKTIDNSAQR